MSSLTGNQPCLPLISNDVLSEVEASYRQEGKLNDQCLLALHTVFGASFERATEMLEKDCVTLLTNAKKTRKVIQVHGRLGELYTLFPNINYCSCPAYHYQVLGANTHLTCKHVLTAHLAIVMGRVRHIELPDKELVKVLCTAAKCDESGDTSLPKG